VPRRRDLRLIGAFDPKLLEIVWLSLRVSLGSADLDVIALPFGAALAVTRFPGRDALVVIVNALLDSRGSRRPGIYLLLPAPDRSVRWASCSRRRRWSSRQAVLIFPLISALARQAVADAWREYAEQMRSLGAGPVASSSRCCTTCVSRW